MKKYGALFPLSLLLLLPEAGAVSETSSGYVRRHERAAKDEAASVSAHLRAIFEARQLRNSKLRYGDKKTNKIEVEPTLRLNVIGFRDRPLSFFSEIEFIQKKKRQTGSSTTTTDTLNFNQAWLQLDKSLVPGGRVRLGRWLLRDEREWLFDENIDGLYARIGDALETEVGLGRVNYWQRNLLDSSTRGDSTNLMTLLSRYEISDGWRVGGYLVWQHDRSSAKNQRQLNAGLRSWSPPRGPFNHWLEVGTVRGQQEQQDLGGYAVDAGATFRLETLPLQPRLTLGYAWGSGGGDDSSSRRYRQTGLQGNEATQGGLVKYKIYGETLDPELTNIHILTAGAGVNLAKDLSADLIYHYYRQHSLAALVSNTTDLDAKYDRMTTKKLGSALDLVLGWRPHPQVRLEAIAGWFAPSSRFYSASGRNSPTASSASSWWMKAEVRF
ncbi:alginate export family protein [Erwinia mallotivora]|uniref:Alginate export domain-containing protein n=1 Tax=Erwinia mallotivora TaxID=69222 RepID=A0A014PU39_9GAMM|nr:alginate export family protein [Erwinia mallotivora]EXU74357.1 hypothetical protein BG55_18060 [Erwinia mallotivora]